MHCYDANSIRGAKTNVPLKVAIFLHNVIELLKLLYAAQHCNSKKRSFKDNLDVKNNSISENVFD